VAVLVGARVVVARADSLVAGGEVVLFSSTRCAGLGNCRQRTIEPPQTLLRTRDRLARCSLLGRQNTMSQSRKTGCSRGQTFRYW